MAQGDPAELLIAAVRRTLRRACYVSVLMRTAVPMMDEFAPGLTDGVRWTGAADFLSNRARLMSGIDEMRFDGSRSYMLMGDGRWQLTEGEVGSWGMFHPRYPLEAVLQAREGVTVLDEYRFRAELDREKLSVMTDAGVSPDWRPLAEVVICDGIVRTVQLELTDRAGPESSIVTAFGYEPVDQMAAIDLPALTDTITAADWIREQETPGS